MSSYNSFSLYYDRLMNVDFDYGKITDYIENLLDMYKPDAKLLCEIACGTGNITIPLSERGYDMIASDKSSDMLNIAKKKAAAKNQESILFLNQDMTKPDLYGTVDAFLCFVDGINYCISSYSLFNMLKKIKTCFLEPDGVFLFDISSEYKLKNIIGNNTFIHDGDDIFYTWENRFIKSKNLSDMYLNFFINRKGGHYTRFSERHLQRAYSTEEILRMLKCAGFKNTDIYDGFTFDKPHKNSERIVFAAY